MLRLHGGEFAQGRSVCIKASSQHHELSLAFGVLRASADLEVWTCRSLAGSSGEHRLGHAQREEVVKGGVKRGMLAPSRHQFLNAKRQLGESRRGQALATVERYVPPAVPPTRSCEWLPSQVTRSLFSSVSDEAERTVGALCGVLLLGSSRSNVHW